MIIDERLRQVARWAIDSGLLDGWLISPDGGAWSHYVPPHWSGPEVGTKLHVSAAVASAPDVLAACLPVLDRHQVPFKHAADLTRLSFLSSGRAGRSQVGKFLTVYPPTDEVAASVAALLHEVTRGLAGPRIPQEEPWAPGSLVYSRRGAFRRQYMQLPTGRIVRSRRTPEGWEIDERTGPDQRPGPAVRVLHDRYVRTCQLAASPKGRTDLAFLDDDGGRLVIVKEAYAHTMEDLSGREARTRLWDEAACLAALGPRGLTPRLLEQWDEEDSSFLAYETVPGPTLAAVLTDLAGRGEILPSVLLLSWARSLCGAVERVHAAGYVCGDIKPANLLLTEEGSVRLIDFELAGPPTDEPTGGMGTVGYCSPQQADADAGRAFADDIYSIGATLLAMATLTEAPLLPDPRQVTGVERRRDQDNPVWTVIERCLSPDPAGRFRSADEITTALASPTTAAAPGPVERMAPLEAAAEIGERLLSSAINAGRHTWWLTEHPTGVGQPCRDLYTGSAGTAVFLAALASATDRERFLDAAEGCGYWLAQTEPTVMRSEPMPGLYFGDCGPGWLYLHLYRANRDPMWLERAGAVARDVAGRDARSPDLMNGIAGIGLFHLAIWRAGGEGAALGYAAGCVDRLLERRDRERPTWRLPEDFDVLSGKLYPGLAHGSAGIGYFLAEYASATQDSTTISASRDVADWIIHIARPVLADGTGLGWSSIDGRSAALGTSWCHGSTGMARFLLSAHGATGVDSHRSAAVAAARAAAAPRWPGTCQCHGLAGNIDLLIDVARDTGDPVHLEAAGDLLAKLFAYRTETGWPSDDRSTWSPDLMVGEAGVGAALLRMAAPRSVHLLSPGALARG
jgi:serine/threonine protein kinase